MVEVHDELAADFLVSHSFSEIMDFTIGVRSLFLHEKEYPQFGAKFENGSEVFKFKVQKAVNEIIVFIAYSQDPFAVILHGVASEDVLNPEFKDHLVEAHVLPHAGIAVPDTCCDVRNHLS